MELNEEIEFIIIKDTSPLSPEREDEYESICSSFHTKEHKSYKRITERCNSIIKYYESDRFVRAYSLVPYEGGIAIIYDKFYKNYYTITLGEDDGSWFPVDSWNFREKNTYIACLSEALSIFNSNFQL